MPYTKQINTLTKIIKVTKKGFNIFSQNDRNFSLVDGSLKGSPSTFNSQCTLITVEERNELKKQWDIEKEIKSIRAMIIQNIALIDPEKLKRIKLIIDE